MGKYRNKPYYTCHVPRHGLDDRTRQNNREERLAKEGSDYRAINCVLSYRRRLDAG